MPKKCVKDKLLSTIDDIELISKDLFESLLTPKPLRQQLRHDVDISQFADLLILKDKELKEAVKDALEQEEFERKMDLLKQEVSKQDDEIKQVQKNLKEAEKILATAIYQAKQKLQFIRKANENPIPSEELIKYAHKISSSHAVAAPYNWEQGDPRRPYPTDMEMRLGLICQQSGFPLNQNLQEHQQTQFSEPNQSPFDKATSSSQFLWQTQQVGPNTPDVKPIITMNQSMNNNLGNLIELKSNGNKDNLEDVEVMSTDSSSSSSSDSQ